MKKLWALLLTLALVVGVVSPITTVYAETNGVVMTVNGTEYTSHSLGWAEAVNLAKSGKDTTVKLFADWIAENGSFVAKDKGGSEYGTSNGHIYVNTNKLTLDLNGYTIDRNLAEGKEGHVLCVEDCKFTIDDTSETKLGKITGGYKTGETSGSGVWVSDATLYLNGGNISGNYGSWGAGVYLDGSAKLEMNGGKITENRASCCGGGVYVESGCSIVLNSGNIDNNVVGGTSAEENSGGGIYLDENSSMTMNGGSVSKNVAENHRALNVFTQGGAIKMEEEVTLTLNGGIIDGNESAYQAGAIWVGNQCYFNMNGGTISNNVAKEGGGIYGYKYVANVSVSPSHLTIKGGKISNNVGNVYGGGIYCTSGSPVVLVDCEITGNRAAIGGGVYAEERVPIYLGGSAKIINNTDMLGSKFFNESNIYMKDNDMGSVGAEKLYNAVGQVDRVPNKPLCEGAEIGVTLTASYIADTPEFAVPNGNGFTSESYRYIKADNPTYNIIWSEQQANDGSIHYNPRFERDEEKVKEYAVATVTANGETYYYATLAEGWISAQKKSKNSSATFTMYDDWLAPNGSFRLNDPEEKVKTNYGRLLVNDSSINLTVDLNGHKIDRNLGDYASDQGQVIYLKSGTLTIKDSAGGGKITGGNSTHDDSLWGEDGEEWNGGGFYIVGSSNLFIEGGEISGNKVTGHGGAIYWNSSGKLCITGGTITGNSADTKGGAIYAEDWGKIYLGGTAVIDENTVKGVESNLYLYENDIDINNAAGQDGVPNNPIREGAYIGISASDTEDLISEDNSRFNEGDFRYFHSDDSRYFIRSVYDAGSAYHAHKLYINSWGNSAARYPRVKTVSVKDSNLLEDAVLDYDSQTITLTAHNTRRNFFERASLADLIECTYDQYKDKDVYYIYEMDHFRDLRSTQEYKIMSDNGTYVLCTVKVVPEGGAWADEQESVNNPYKMTVTIGASTKGFTDFGEGWVYAVDQSQPATITLFDDWNAPNGEFAYSKGTDSGRLHLSGGDDITIDLNGNDINRGLTSAVSSGQVFRLASGAKLTITDDSDMKNGKITGGYNSDNGGAFYIDYGKLYLNGGEISGNKASNGAGIYGTNKNDTYVYINGGKVTNNTASSNGGGIYMEDGHLYVDGGEISGNNAKNGAGVYWASDNKCCLTDGVITSNTASSNGGGVYAANYGKLFLGGTIKITGNTKGNLYLSEKAVNIHNAAGQDGSINKPLAEGAYVGITAKDKNDIISGDNSKFNKADCEYLYSDEDSYFVRAVYDANGNSNSHKIYYSEKSANITVPSITSAESKSIEVSEVALDKAARTITLKVGYEYKEGRLSYTNLDTHINVLFDSEGTSMPDIKEYHDLTKPQKYMVLGADGTYSIWTVMVEWVCKQHNDEDGDGICDNCKENMYANFTIVDYNAETKEATVFITKPGKYSLIFADYEDTRLANVDIVEYDFVEGINVVPQEVTKFTLASDDKVMLWYDLINLVPVCDALTIK